MNKKGRKLKIFCEVFQDHGNLILIYLVITGNSCLKKKKRVPVVFIVQIHLFIQKILRVYSVQILFNGLEIQQ